MKKLLWIIPALVFMSCDISKTDNDDTQNEKIVCKVITVKNYNEVDSIFFDEEDIVWFNKENLQLKLKNTPEIKEIQRFSKFKFYLGQDSIFTARLALDLMSSIVSDLVLHYNSYNGNIYLEDSYPNWIKDSVCIVNKDKRAANWKRFIDRLEKVDKIK